MTTIEPGSTGHNEALGVTLQDVTPDRVTLTMEIGPQHHQPYGIVHGGVWCALVETAASVAAARWLDDRGRVVGVSNHTDFLRAVGDGTATATATPIHRGRLQQLWLVEVTHDSGKLIARGEVRLQNLPEDFTMPADRS
jgi:1,4-dihydroxy-2-naphthoyl-CoA hydrolase